MHFDEKYTPYKAAYSSMPFHAADNPSMKQRNIDEYFCHKWFGASSGISTSITRTFSADVQKSFLKRSPIPRMKTNLSMMLYCLFPSYRICLLSICSSTTICLGIDEWIPLLTLQRFIKKSFQATPFTRMLTTIAFTFKRLIYV